ncbi:hypothetical protein MAA_11336 [Metarhizium robertsii ARSEF 23]|uniref:Uncharacterized protein n=1 Tax=Metarhizium robertsii (strain ARSEF 23 / ATCC MYA-3075) TaxID=655844 RepID=A0A0B2XHR5_METRA|nr:uncharacterized protein MAA_11336 [Metarhizium robertsii ARSEF 23]KHO11067.1 hypothetical protein MAA_11336 [Metarhizium robertsii ARSEF 23]
MSPYLGIPSRVFLATRIHNRDSVSSAAPSQKKPGIVSRSGLLGDRVSRSPVLLTICSLDFSRLTRLCLTPKGSSSSSPSPSPSPSSTAPAKDDASPSPLPPTSSGRRAETTACRGRTAAPNPTPVKRAPCPRGVSIKPCRLLPPRVPSPRTSPRRAAVRAARPLRLVAVAVAGPGTTGRSISRIAAAFCA